MKKLNKIYKMISLFIIKISSNCVKEPALIFLMPFVALAMVGESIGSNIPHSVVQNMDKRYQGVGEIERLAKCYRLMLARHYDPMVSWEATLEKKVGQKGALAARAYAISYHSRGDRLFAVNDFSQKILELFKEYIGNKISIVQELTKLVVLLVGMSVLVVSMTAFVTSSPSALKMIAFATVASSALLLLVVDTRRLVNLIHSNKITKLYEVIYFIFLIIYFVSYGWRMQTLAMTAATSALVVALIKTAALAQSIREISELRLAVRRIGDEYLTAGRTYILRTFKEVRSKQVKLILTSLKGIEPIDHSLPTLFRITRDSLSRLLYGGTYRHVKVIENILETVEASLRRLASTWIMLSLTLITVYIASLAASIALLKTFQPDTVHDSYEASIVNISTNVKVLQDYTMMTAVAVAIAATSISLSMMGTLVNPAVPMLMIANIAAYHLLPMTSLIDLL